MKICLFSPSSPSPKEAMEQGLSILQQELGPLCPGLEIASIGSFMEKARPNPRLDYIAYGDGDKAMEFNRLFQQKDINFIFCCRGGYGALRWLDMVEWRGIKVPPVLIGFSDVTVILAAFLKGEGTAIHGPMLNTLSETDPKARQALWEFMLTGKLPVLQGVSFRKGNCQGKLIGGNLTCLCHLIGTPFEPDWKGKILFLEDCNEPLYRLDRMLTHMRLRGVFNMIGGLALGYFKGMKDEKMFFNLLRDMFSDAPFPVIMGLPAGHGSKNMPLMIGGIYRLEGRDAVLIPLS